MKGLIDVFICRHRNWGTQGIEKGKKNSKKKMITNYLIKDLEKFLQPKITIHRDINTSKTVLCCSWTDLCVTLLIDKDTDIQTIPYTLLSLFGAEFAKIPKNQKMNFIGVVCGYCKSKTRDLNGKCSGCGALV